MRRVTKIGDTGVKPIARSGEPFHHRFITASKLIPASLPDGSDILDDEVELDYNRQVFIQKMIQ